MLIINRFAQNGRSSGALPGIGASGATVAGLPNILTFPSIAPFTPLSFGTDSAIKPLFPNWSPCSFRKITRLYPLPSVPSFLVNGLIFACRSS